MAFNGKCPPCSGKRMLKCGGPSCGVVFVDIGVGYCPFCGHRYVKGVSR